jgi:hypothetical protein
MRTTLAVLLIALSARRRRWRWAWLAALAGCLPWCRPAAAQEADPEALRVEAQLAGGVHYVGQGFELQLGVVARGRRPEVEPPSIAGADVWLVRNELKPVTVSGIGRTITGTNVYISRFRIVPRRAGALEVPSIKATVKGEAGRSKPLRTTVKPLPPEGRPAEFLGGVGRFTVQADASPRSVRVGQEFEYRLTISGPAAWGTTGRPELKPFDRLSVGLRIQTDRVDAMREPPSRTFAYRMRPSRPGDVVLPPVAVAAFDPSTMHYITRLSPGVPVKVVAVPPFDASAIPDLNRSTSPESRATALRWALGLCSAAVLLGAAIALRWVRRGARRAGRTVGAAAARHYAAGMARDLARRGLPPGRDASELALAIGEALVRYLELGNGRPPGALTPAEAGSSVASCTGSDELGERASQLAARCDALLYRDVPALPEDPDRLRQDARDLFRRLARA